MLYWTIIVILCASLVRKAPTVDGAINDREYNLLRAYDCDTGAVEFDYFGNASHLGYDLTIRVTDEITNDHRLQIAVDAWNNGEWQTFLHIHKGPACEVLKSHGCGLCKLWDHFRREIKPPIKEMCVIKRHLYELEHFKADESDIPGEYNAPLGTYRTTVKLYDEYDYELFCEIFEVEVKSRKSK